MSKLFNLDWKDLFNGVAFAVTGSVLTTLLDLLIDLQNGGIVTIADWKLIGIAGAIAGVTYIVKRFFSNNEGKILGADKPL